MNGYARGMKKIALTVIAAGLMFGQQKADPNAVPKQATDPVCGMTVDPKASDTQKSEYKGKTYYFCSREDKAKFDKSPAQYAAKADAKK